MDPTQTRQQQANPLSSCNQEISQGEIVEENSPNIDAVSPATSKKDIGSFKENDQQQGDPQIIQEAVISSRNPEHQMEAEDVEIRCPDSPFAAKLEPKELQEEKNIINEEHLDERRDNENLVEEEANQEYSTPIFQQKTPVIDEKIKQKSQANESSPKIEKAVLEELLEGKKISEQNLELVDVDSKPKQKDVLEEQVRESHQLIIPEPMDEQIAVESISKINEQAQQKSKTNQQIIDRPAAQLQVISHPQLIPLPEQKTQTINQELLQIIEECQQSKKVEASEKFKQSEAQIIQRDENKGQMEEQNKKQQKISEEKQQSEGGMEPLRKQGQAIETDKKNEIILFQNPENQANSPQRNIQDDLDLPSEENHEEGEIQQKMDFPVPENPICQAHQSQNSKQKSKEIIPEEPNQSQLNSKQPETLINPKISSEKQIPAVLPIQNENDSAVRQPIKQKPLVKEQSSHTNGKNGQQNKQKQAISEPPNHNFAMDSPELTDINEIRKVLLANLPPHIKQMVQNLNDQQLRLMYLQIRAEQARNNAPQTNQNPQVNVEKAPKEPQVNSEQKKSEKSLSKSSNCKKVSKEEKIQNRSQQIKPRKRVVTTIVQQIEYFEYCDEEPRVKKVMITNSGEARKKNGPKQVEETQKKILQLGNLIQAMNFASLSGDEPEQK